MEHDSLIVTIALNAWNDRVGRFHQLFTNFSEEQVVREIAPGKNRGIYLVGHLVAYHDALSTILDLGPRLHPELDHAFLQHPDKVGLSMPSVTELKQYWVEVHERLAHDFQQMPVEAWFTRHMAVSAEDFQHEPHRNKLGVLLNRTNHLAYHTAQLILLK
jgi:hypothetical protein